MPNYPKPAALKLVEGNPGKRPINEKEPKPVITAEAPSWVKPEVMRIWNEIAPKLAILGILSEIDVQAFARYCDTMHHWLRLHEFLHRAGTAKVVWEMVPDPNPPADNPTKQMRVIKEVIAYPQAKQYKEYSELLLRLEMQFGMTPSMRSKLQVESPELRMRGFGNGDDDDLDA